MSHQLHLRLHPTALTKTVGAPMEKACGHCDSCRLRLQGFKEAGYRDEIEYEHGENLL